MGAIKSLVNAILIIVGFALMVLSVIFGFNLRIDLSVLCVLGAIACFVSLRERFDDEDGIDDNIYDEPFE